MAQEVVFVPADFKAAYPAFAAVPDAALEHYFQMATLYLSNSACSVVKDLEKRKMLLWMLVAHIAQLAGALNEGGAAGPVGRVASATEGSVSVSFAFPDNANGAWFNQTPWGAMFWQATLQYRIGPRYVARPTVWY